MLNLYGDLPPPSSSNSNENFEEHGSLLSAQPLKTTTSAATGKPFITLKPSSLAFKPRQTKAYAVPPLNPVTSSGRSSNISEVTLSHSDTVVLESKNSAVPTQLLEKKQHITKDTVKEKEYNLIDEEIDEFKNKNTSFEVSEQDAYDPRRPND